MKKLLYYSIVLCALSSCKVREEYSRPAGAVPEDLYRTDLIPADGTSAGSLSWREIFTDALLQNHLTTALENNLDLRIAVQNIAAADAYLMQSKAAYQPTITVGPSYSLQSPSLNTQTSQNRTRRYGSQFDLSAALAFEPDLWGKLKSQELAQLAAYNSTLAAHQDVTSDLVATIATSYYQLLAYDEQKEIITKTIALRQKNLETTKALKQAGVLTEVALQQSEALVYNAEALIINIDVQIAQLENTISILKGLPPAAIERSTLATQKFSVLPQTGIPAQLLENRPDVRRAEFGLINAFELTNAAKAQFYPSLRLTANTGLQAAQIDQFFSGNSFFMGIVGGLTYPQLNRRQLKTGYEVARAEQEKAYLTFRKTILQAGKEVSDALKIYVAQDSFISLKEKELMAYQNSVEYSQQLVNYGMANYLEVLNASVNQLNTELSITNAEFTRLQAGVELYRALGGGWR